MWAHTAGTLGTGLTLVGKVTTTYATPVTTAMAGSTDMTTAISIGSGAAVLYHATGPEGASPAATLAAGGGYTQYLATQLQTTGSAGAGDTATVTLTLRYDEN